MSRIITEAVETTYSMVCKNVATVFITLKTQGWTQDLVAGLREFLPGQDIFAFNNNPRRDQSISQPYYYTQNANWEPICDEEVNWLKDQSDIQIVDLAPSMDCSQRLPTHGESIDAAFKHVQELGYEIALHVEPDCLVMGKDWFHDLLKPLNEGMWMTSTKKLPSGRFHPTASMWRLKEALELGVSFDCTLMGKDKNDPEFQGLINVDLEDFDWNKQWWDAACKPWYECAKLGKVQYVPTGEFKHLWNGSIRRHSSRHIKMM